MSRKTFLLGLINWLFLTSVIIVSSCKDTFTQNNIYGVWQGEYLGKKLMFNFNSDGTCLIKIEDISTNSIEILNGIFVIDFSKNPIPLSIRNILQLNHPLHTIVEIIDTDSIRLGSFAPKWRVRDISFQLNKSITLKRLK